MEPLEIVQQDVKELLASNAAQTERLDALKDRFDKTLMYLGKHEERIQSLERTRSWSKGVGSVLAALWTGFLALLGVLVAHHLNSR